MVGFSPAALSSRSACSRVKDLDGRPGWPFGRSHNNATLRLTRSRARARRIECRRIESRRSSVTVLSVLVFVRKPAVDFLSSQLRKPALAESRDDMSASQACPVRHRIRVAPHEAMHQPGLNSVADGVRALVALACCKGARLGLRASLCGVRRVVAGFSALSWYTFSGFGVIDLTVTWNAEWPQVLDVGCACT